MSDCCTMNDMSTNQSRRHICPENGLAYIEVARSTVLQHIRQPWRHILKDQRYYFCDDPDCEVVYFAEDNSVIRKDQLRTRVGVKETSDDALICYCFDVTRENAQNDPAAKAFVVEQTRRSSCACESQNPSGRCCLKDFPR